MQVIIPCAGRSTRYPTSRPKFLLTMPDGRPMFMHAADPYYGKYPLTFVVVKEHCRLYDADVAIKNAYNNSVTIVVLEDFAQGPAETVYKAIKTLPDTAFISHDCDGFFEYELTENSNFVATANLQDYPFLTNVAAKSFALSDDNLLKNIVEKSVISNNICAGAYGFSSSKRYCSNFEAIAKSTKEEIYISHIIKHDLCNTNTNFKTIQVKNYIDCGTYDDFIKISKKYSTIFTDLDGVVFKNQSQYFSNNYSNKPVLNQLATKFLLEKQKNGATIIFTTSRPSKFKQITETALHDAGFKNIQVLYDLPHAPRLLINDINVTNPWPSASAINAPRDDDNFWKSLL